MRRLAVLVLMLATPLFAAEPLPAARRIARDVELLAHPALRGREAGTPEAALAQVLVAQRFEQLGLTPAGAAGGWYQPVPMVEVSADLAAGGLAVTVGGKTQTAAQGRGAWIELTGAPPAEATTALDVAFAGWGIRALDKGHDDYAALDVKGKAVLVWSGEPKLADGMSPFTKGRMSRFALTPIKLDAAARAGAALLIVAAPPGGKPVEESYRRDEREKLRPRLALAGTPPSIPVVYLGAEAAAALFAGASADPAALLTEAVPGKPVGRALAGARVQLALPKLATREVGERNVLGLLAGSDAKLAVEPVVLSAHGDHIGADRAADGTMTVYAGADDDASGVAALLAAAEALAAGPRPPRPVLFAVFCGEEKGALGSTYYVAHPLPDGARPMAAIDLDMVSRNNLDRADYAKVVMASYAAKGAAMGPALKAAASGAGLDVRNLPYLRSPGRSDDAPFAEKKIPSVMLFTGPHADYNTPNDTAERIDAAKAAAIADMAARLARDLAVRTERIAWDDALAEAPPSDKWDRPY